LYEKIVSHANIDEPTAVDPAADISYGLSKYNTTAIKRKVSKIKTVMILINNRKTRKEPMRTKFLAKMYPVP
jgi:hypothetical protein